MHSLTEAMHRVALWVQHVAEQLGGPGLTLVAFFDSSFVTLPEVADLLVIIFTIRQPDLWLYFGAMTTAGSVAGSFALYLVGRKGGDAMLRRRFHERHIDRGLAWFRRYGAAVLVVPSMLPPPMPFKIFVLLAGVSGVPRGRFLLSVALGRGTRYCGVALLARWYGDRAVRFVQQNVFDFLLPVGVGVVLLGGAWWLWRRLARPTGGPPAIKPEGGIVESADIE